jgi:hypothetical protein
MAKQDEIARLYERVIEEQMTPLAVKKTAKGDGETGALEPGELPADAASTTEVQSGTGAENAKDVEAAEEAPEDISPVKKDKGTMKTATKKTVTEAEAPRKSFTDLFDQVMISEEGEDIESPEYDDDLGDFPEDEEDVETEGPVDEGEIFSQLADLFSQLASIRGAGEESYDEEPEGELDDMEEPPIGEAKSEPEPKVLQANSSERQLPTKLAGKGVKKGSSKAKTGEGGRKRTGELEDAPEGFRHDKSKYAVNGEGPIHKAKNASFLES